MVKQKLGKKSSASNIKKQLAEAKKLANEYLDNLQRLQAEFDNYRKRMDAEKAELVAYATRDFVIKLLDVIDNFNRAVESKKINVQGLELIRKQFNSILEAEGLKPIKSVGQKFDPALHEAVSCEGAKCEENIILKEVRKGYLLKDKPIRIAQVIISKSKEVKENG